MAHSSSEACVAIIPARGGSKGIPLKNLQEVNGRSLVARAVLSAQASGCFSNVYVSTDLRAIANEASSVGAEVLWRNSALSNDEASTESVLLHHLQVELQDISETFALIQCTSPFIGSNALTQGLSTLASGFQSVFSGIEDHVFRWELGPGGDYIPFGHTRAARPRRQDLPKRVTETGAFYFANTLLFLEEKSRFCGRVGAVLVDRVDAIEIDSPADLDLARQLSRAWDEKEQQNANWKH